MVNKITALDVQIALWNELQTSRSFIMPNYTPKNWFECDVMAVTKAGYLEEYEIKLSASDFKADSKKCFREGYLRGKRIGGKNKHQELGNKSPDGPSRFWFVVSHNILDKIEIPEWAGLKVAYDFNKNGRLYLKELKKAPKLHTKKIDDKIVEHAKSVCYWRYWNTKCDVDKCVKRELRRLENQCLS